MKEKWTKLGKSLICLALVTSMLWRRWQQQL